MESSEKSLFYLKNFIIFLMIQSCMTQEPQGASVLLNIFKIFNENNAMTQNKINIYLERMRKDIAKKSLPMYDLEQVNFIQNMINEAHIISHIVYGNSFLSTLSQYKGINRTPKNNFIFLLDQLKNYLCALIPNADFQRKFNRQSQEFFENPYFAKNILVRIDGLQNVLTYKSADYQHIIETLYHKNLITLKEYSAIIAGMLPTDKQFILNISQNSYKNIFKLELKKLNIFSFNCLLFLKNILKLIEAFAPNLVQSLKEDESIPRGLFYDIEQEEKKQLEIHSQEVQDQEKVSSNLYCMKNNNDSSAITALLINRKECDILEIYYSDNELRTYVINIKKGNLSLNIFLTENFLENFNDINELLNYFLNLNYAFVTSVSIQMDSFLHTSKNGLTIDIASNSKYFNINSVDSTLRHLLNPITTSYLNLFLNNKDHPFNLALYKFYSEAPYQNQFCLTLYIGKENMEFNFQNGKSFVKICAPNKILMEQLHYSEKKILFKNAPNLEEHIKKIKNIKNKLKEELMADSLYMESIEKYLLYQYPPLKKEFIAFISNDKLFKGLRKEFYDLNKSLEDKYFMVLHNKKFLLYKKDKNIKEEYMREEYMREEIIKEEYMREKIIKEEYVEPLIGNQTIIPENQTIIPEFKEKSKKRKAAEALNSPINKKINVENYLSQPISHLNMQAPLPLYKIDFFQNCFPFLEIFMHFNPSGLYKNDVMPMNWTLDNLEKTINYIEQMNINNEIYSVTISLKDPNEVKIMNKKSEATLELDMNVLLQKPYDGYQVNI
jgi:hypothetical protein